MHRVSRQSRSSFVKIKLRSREPLAESTHEYARSGSSRTFGNDGDDPVRRTGSVPVRNGPDDGNVESHRRRTDEVAAREADCEPIHRRCCRSLCHVGHSVVVGHDSAGGWFCLRRPDVTVAGNRRDHGRRDRYDDHRSDHCFQDYKGSSRSRGLRLRAAVSGQKRTPAAVRSDDLRIRTAVLRHESNERRDSAAA